MASIIFEGTFGSGHSRSNLTTSKATFDSGVDAISGIVVSGVIGSMPIFLSFTKADCRIPNSGDKGRNELASWRQNGQKYSPL